jgi:acyl CoA:acetate/3-ketoacid CoA transferase beta subunit
MIHCNSPDQKKIMKECTLPVTGRRVVSLIVTDLAVFEVSATKGLTLIELSPDTNLAEVTRLTDAPFIVSPQLKEMQQ